MEKKNLENEVLKYLDDLAGDYQKRNCNPDADYLMSKDDMLDFATHFANRQKEQMMKDAYDAYVSYIRDSSEAVVYLNNTSITMPSHFPKRDLEEGDKLKIVIIKED